MFGVVWVWSALTTLEGGLRICFAHRQSWRRANTTLGQRAKGQYRKYADPNARDAPSSAHSFSTFKNFRRILPDRGRHAENTDSKPVVCTQNPESFFIVPSLSNEETLCTSSCRSSSALSNVKFDTYRCCFTFRDTQTSSAFLSNESFFGFFDFGTGIVFTGTNGPAVPRTCQSSCGPWA